jgi:signal transduction histidine kinase
VRLSSLGEYISELVDFAKPAVIHPEPLPVASLFQNLRLAALQALPGVTIDLQVMPDAATIVADPYRLNIILKGLLRNAVESALNTRSPQVQLRACRTEREGQPGITLHVADNGRGFSPAAYDHAFEPFYSTKEAGTGLGLAVALKVVNAHGGTITLGSSPQLGGALVSLFLPDLQHRSTTGTGQQR